MANDDHVGWGRGGEYGRSRLVDARRLPLRPRSVLETGATDNRAVVLDDPPAGTLHHELCRGHWSRTYRNRDRSRPPLIAIDGAGHDRDLRRGRDEHGVHDLTVGFEGGHQAVGRKALDGRPLPRCPAVVGGPEIGPVDPSVVEVREADASLLDVIAVGDRHRRLWQCDPGLAAVACAAAPCSW